MPASIEVLIRQLLYFGLTHIQEVSEQLPLTDDQRSVLCENVYIPAGILSLVMAFIQTCYSATYNDFETTQCLLCDRLLYLCDCASSPH